MDFKSSDAPRGPRPGDILPQTAAAAVKIVIVGGFGVGKTTMVGAVSEIRPLTTEETMTKAGIGVDDTRGVARKTTTTVAMDFGRISINDELVLYLFGTPGQERFWFLWRGLFEGALGAVVLLDTRRLETSFDVIGRLRRNGASPSSWPSTPSPTPPSIHWKSCAKPSTCPAPYRSSSATPDGGTRPATSC